MEPVIKYEAHERGVVFGFFVVSSVMISNVVISSVVVVSGPAMATVILGGKLKVFVVFVLFVVLPINHVRRYLLCSR